MNCFVSYSMGRMIKTEVRLDANRNEVLYRFTNWLSECDRTEILLK